MQNEKIQENNKFFFIFIWRDSKLFVTHILEQGIMI